MEIGSQWFDRSSDQLKHRKCKRADSFWNDPETLNVGFPTRLIKQTIMKAWVWRTWNYATAIKNCFIMGLFTHFLPRVPTSVKDAAGIIPLLTRNMITFLLLPVFLSDWLCGNGPQPCGRWQTTPPPQQCSLWTTLRSAKHSLVLFFCWSQPLSLSLSGCLIRATFWWLCRSAGSVCFFSRHCEPMRGKELCVDGMQTVCWVTGCWLRGARPQAFDALALVRSSLFSLPYCVSAASLSFPALCCFHFFRFSSLSLFWLNLLVQCTVLAATVPKLFCKTWCQPSPNELSHFFQRRHFVHHVLLLFLVTFLLPMRG